MSPHRLCLIHPLDPRVAAADVVEARLAAIFAARPIDFSLLVVGVDEVGDLAPGVVVTLEVGGRRFDFLPVARGRDGGFAAGLLRHLVAVRAAARADFASVAVHDVAWAVLARLVGRPLVLVVHRDPRAGAVAGRAPMSTILREAMALRAADRIVGCDGDFVHRCRDGHPVIAAKTELLAMTPAEDAAVVALFADDRQITRLWERHRRLFDVQASRRGEHAAA